MYISLYVRNRDGVVSMATQYVLEGPGIESRWGRDFHTYPNTLRGPPSLLYSGYRIFPGGKGGRGVMSSLSDFNEARVFSTDFLKVLKYQLL
jgi:hypothetical protein